MKTLVYLIVFITSVSLAFGQKKFTEEQKKVLDYLEPKRAEFKKAKNDSLFVVQNSDQGFFYATFTRGDQAEDIEEQIYHAKVGDVVGPFDGENVFYLLKIVKYDSSYRTKAKQLNFYPKGEMTSDTAKFRKLVDKYISALSQGKEIGKMAIKDEASLGIRSKMLGSFWEGQTSKENYDLLFDRKVSDPYVKKAGQEIHVIYILEEKKKAAYKAKAVMLVKKVQ